MGSCLSQTQEGNKKRRRSSLIDLDDSRHVMFKQTSKNGAIQQADGSFYRPRGEMKVAAISSTDTATGTSDLQLVTDE